MSCMIEAMEGMVISTTDEEAVEFRKYVIEWLMLHHPHDCPVCDEGGHCLLQDETVSGGHGLRRYVGYKRTYEDQYLGPFVQHEMNRCIHCFRCRRFYQEFAGYRDLGALQIGKNMYFGRFSNGTLESPFSGNLIDICPTGVFTDKPARYKGRRWDFERGPSICPHCSLGCNTTTSARYREIIRQEGRLNEEVNGYFICDRGRFGYDFANHPDRPRRPRVGERSVDWDEALQAASEALTQVAEGAGPGAIAFLGSSRSSLETQGQLARFCRIHGWPDPQFFSDLPMERKVKKAISRLDASLGASMAEIEGADFILAVGADPVSEAPMLALAMRQAHRNGGTVAMIDPRPLSLPFEFEHLPVPVKDLNLFLGVLVKMSMSRAPKERLGKDALAFFDALPGDCPSDPPLQDRLENLARALQQSKSPVIICGTDVVREETTALAADCADLLKSTKGKAGLFYLFPGPNSYGASLLSRSGGSAWEMVEAIEQGRVKALMLLESDPFFFYPERERLERALSRLDLLLVMDYLPTPSAEKAHILLPTLTLFEGGGSSFVNQEGRVQFAPPIHRGGTSISQVSGGSHPPRTFSRDVPGGEAKAAVEILRDLASHMSAPGKGDLVEDIWVWLTGENPLFATEPSSSWKTRGLRLLPEEPLEKAYSRNQRPEDPERIPGDGLELLLVDWTFGTEELSSYSKYIYEVETLPRVTLHRSDASRLGFSDGERITLHLPGGSLNVELKAMENMARGVMVLPRHRQLDWQRVPGGQLSIPFKAIEKS